MGIRVCPKRHPGGVERAILFPTVHTGSVCAKIDFERSALCVDWYSGNWEFWVLNGSGSPSYFYGEGTVTSGPGYMRLVGIPGGPYTINLTYYTNVNRAVATFGCRLCRPSAVGSALYDKDTTDDEWYCGGESRPN